MAQIVQPVAIGFAFVNPNGTVTNGAARVMQQITSALNGSEPLPNIVMVTLGNGVNWYSAAGSPIFDAPIGSLYTNTTGSAGTTLYVKESLGTGGWVGK